MTVELSREEIEEHHRRLLKDAAAGGYNLNPDMTNTMTLVEGLLTNTKRYGYPLCPCRLSGGSREADLDVICPCDYRDADLDEYDTCFCGLYVSGRALEGEVEVGSIPERRPPAGRGGETAGERPVEKKPGEMTVWRCRVCGYLCARKSPPEVCPICRVPRERFEPFDFT